MASKFPNTQRFYQDSRKCGGISVRGFYLETDKDGLVEAPADLADEIFPHGFVPVDRDDYLRQRAAAAQPQQARR